MTVYFIAVVNDSKFAYKLQIYYIYSYMEPMTFVDCLSNQFSRIVLMDAKQLSLYFFCE